MVCLFQLWSQLVEVELLIDGYLVPCAAVEENYKFLRDILVAVEVGRDATKSQVPHGCEFFLRVGEDFRSGVDGGKG